ncbi:hypothetical protein [Candidatus Albibeggiatoa sp. nov. NOAA]|uniref:hypothetical protein n=1 Tax=Candidatus Albibeggiatoa sp. nov. NOAA TaxID=3162724 RepID=UPI0032FCD0A8|nr:hypothetical protein [Thiotrichaceae bacterium]
MLSQQVQTLLQWSQDFVMPLPIEALEKILSAEAVQGLFTLGLWDAWRDEESMQPAAMLNRLAQRLCEDLDENQERMLAQKLLSPLWAVWQPVEQRSLQADYQLIRLAVRVVNTEVLQDAAGYGVRWAQNNISFTEAKALGLKSIECLEKDNIEPDNRLLRFTAESCQRVGGQGDIEQAFELHQRRLNILPEDKEWERAVAAGGLADILQSRGQLDEALRIRETEQLPVYERLGDALQYLIVQAKIAMLLMEFKPPYRSRHPEANQLLCEALHAAQQMRIPEAEQIQQILQHFDMQCTE